MHELCRISILYFVASQRAREANANLAGKQERALNVLKVRNGKKLRLVSINMILLSKSKLLEKISNSSATDQVTGERLLQEYHINIQVLDEELKRCEVKVSNTDDALIATKMCQI